MRRVLLGTWSTMGGNSVDAFLTGTGSLRALALEWDRFPFSVGDAVEYYARILPEVARRAAEYLETPGRVVVARP